MERPDDIDGAMMRYIAGDDQSEMALLKAQLEHMGGALSREIELNAEAQASRLTEERDAAIALADDAIALANEWDKNMWDLPGARVMDADLADLYRQRAALATPPDTDALAAPEVNK